VKGTYEEAAERYQRRECPRTTRRWGWLCRPSCCAWEGWRWVLRTVFLSQSPLSDGYLVRVPQVW